ncbi:hypothetical protein [Allohahella sp. A8]|uniref:hypothetical protein n=1 Tax=Allohahella sp. A8 TaxID=3141461 RepID=UPI000C0B367C|nr:hypothetical protein [Hahellaceae bacterium]
MRRGAVEIMGVVCPKNQPSMLMHYIEHLYTCELARALTAHQHPAGAAQRIDSLHDGATADASGCAWTGVMADPDGVREPVKQEQAQGQAIAAPRYGSFAMACITDQGDILLSCDQAGVAPLYYRRVNHAILFSTSLHFLATLTPDTTLHAGHLNHFLTTGLLPGSETLFQGIFRLEAGQTVRIRQQAQEVRLEFETQAVPALAAGLEVRRQFPLTLKLDEPATAFGTSEAFLATPRYSRALGSPSDMSWELSYRHQFRQHSGRVICCDLGAPVDASNSASRPMYHKLLRRRFRKAISATQSQAIRETARKLLAPRLGTVISDLEIDRFIEFKWLLPDIARRLFVTAGTHGCTVLFPALNTLHSSLSACLNNGSPEELRTLLRSPSRLPREIRHASAHFNLSDPSAVNVFDAAQRLYRHGRSESLLNRVFNLTPWRTVRFLPEGNPVQAERFALTFLTLDYQLRINRCRQISEIE